MYPPAGGRGVDRLVDVVDRLRSDGGCPWYAAQDRSSLAPYAVEEAHELAEAIAVGERDHLVEELGDVLLQVVLHARLGQEDVDPFGLDDVAEGAAAKLVRRNPHVFGAQAGPLDVAEVERRWEQLKAAEKPERTSLLDGIAPSLPALQRAQKLQDRMARTGIDVGDGNIGDADVVALWSAVARLRARGLDAEQALTAHAARVGEAADEAARASTQRDR